MENSQDLIVKLEGKAYDIRNQTLDMCIRAHTGHVTSSFSCADILISLYYGGILRYDAKKPEWQDRDRLIPSKGQNSPILYNILADLDFFPKDWLYSFCGKDAKLGVHLQCDVPGVEITAGSLGHGLSFGEGIAEAAKMDRKDYLTFVLLGDAELYEGSNWEPMMYIPHKRLNNLIGIVDRNWLGVTGFTENILKLEPLDEKFKSFGWNTKRINGHNFQQILNSFEGIREFRSDKPLMIIADTVKGYGIPSWQNVPSRHGIAPMGEEIEQARRELKEFYKK